MPPLEHPPEHSNVSHQASLQTPEAYQPDLLGNPLTACPDISTARVSSGQICIHLSSSKSARSSISTYLKNHPPGVVDIAFQVSDLDGATHRAVRAGARLLSPPDIEVSHAGVSRRATVSGWGDLQHTLVEPMGSLGNASSVQNTAQNTGINPSCQGSPDALTTAIFTDIDHAVLNVPVGEMSRAAAWYEEAFGLVQKQTFDIQTERSALRSRVLVHPDGNVQLPINEPASSGSQIQEFLDVNQGAGIQHIALKTPDILHTMTRLRQRGVRFLPVPPAYYEQLRQRPGFQASDTDWGAIATLEILVDWQQENPEALLLQAFTQPIFGQPTFFFEVIQRQFFYSGQRYQPVQGFGEGNFRALFEAIEREQLKRGTLR